MTPPTGYSGYTYQGLDTANLGTTTVGGVEFTPLAERIQAQLDGEQRRVGRRAGFHAMQDTGRTIRPGGVAHFDPQRTARRQCGPVGSHDVQPEVHAYRV